jgi:hypothetical protein
MAIERSNYLNEPKAAKELPRLPCDVTCGSCEHTAWWERFNEDAFGVELPPNNFRCPSCGIMWRRERVAGKYDFSDPIIQCTVIPQMMLGVQS